MGSSRLPKGAPLAEFQSTPFPGEWRSGSLCFPFDSQEHSDFRAESAPTLLFLLDSSPKISKVKAP